MCHNCGLVLPLMLNDKKEVQKLLWERRITTLDSVRVAVYWPTTIRQGDPMPVNLGPEELERLNLFEQQLVIVKEEIGQAISSAIPDTDIIQFMSKLEQEITRFFYAEKSLETPEYVGFEESLSRIAIRAQILTLATMISKSMGYHFSKIKDSLLHTYPRKLVNKAFGEYWHRYRQKETSVHVDPVNRRYLGFSFPKRKRVEFDRWIDNPQEIPTEILQDLEKMGLTRYRRVMQVTLALLNEAQLVNHSSGIIKVTETIRYSLQEARDNPKRFLDFLRRERDKWTEFIAPPFNIKLDEILNAVDEYYRKRTRG